MKIDILTLFPEMFEGPFATSMLKKAKDIGAVEINTHNLRDWAKDKHKTVDDRPYGGGAGMVMMVEPIYEALKELLKTENRRQKTASENRRQKTEVNSQSSVIRRQDQPSVFRHPSSTKIILTSAKGKVFNQKKAQSFSKLDHLIIICGHYEGVDERVARHLVDEEISIGKYVLTGGEIPAMVITDSVVRLIPGVLGNPDSLSEESYSELKIENSKIENCTEYPQYTRPESYQGWKVPEVLLSGNHAEIEKWRKRSSS